MYRPNPFKQSTLHAWIQEASDELARNQIANPSVQLVMKYIHKHHPGVLFSPHWFSAQYKRYTSQPQISLG